MLNLRPFAVCLLSLGVTLVTLNPALAADAPPGSPDPPAAAAAQDQDDDAAFEPAEPNFRLLNSPTTMRLPRLKGNFELTHRFAGNLRRGSFSDNASHLFGIDEGATVGFEYRFAPVRHLQLIAYRVTFQQTLQLYAKYDALHQSASMPLSASAVISSEGISNFQDQYASSLGASLSRKFGDVAAFYAVPIWVNNTAAGTGRDRDTFYVGLGGRIRVLDTVYLAAEVSPRLSGYAPGEPEFGFAIEKRAGGHMFQLNLMNTAGTTFAQVARGGTPRSLYLGFNLSRKFF